MTKIFRTKKDVYTVDINEQGFITLRDILNGGVFKGTASLIAQRGGRENFLALCEDGDPEAIKAEIKAERRAKAAAKAQTATQDDEMLAAAREMVTEAYKNGTVIESTIDNIKSLLRYLNSMNWGMWQLPKMSVGYSCNQYGCDGKTATTIILDEPVEGGTRYVFGAPVGHINGYARI